MSKTLLIVPCYNETQRLPVAEFVRFAKQGLLICFADDGSSDGTFEFLNKQFGGMDNVSVFRSATNLGKAGVVRAAALDLLQKSLPQDVEWIGYWDADLATPLKEVELLLRFRNDFAPQAVGIFGSRVLRLGASIRRSTLRHYLGRVFATLASVMLGVKSYDSQCGAKLFHRSVLKDVFAEAFISRWLFDLEILLRLSEARVVEYPVSQWEDVPGSKVKIFSEIFRVFGDLLKIRSRYISR